MQINRDDCYLRQAEIQLEIRRMRQLSRLGVSELCCPGCGQTDSRCFEGHHPAGRAYHADEVPMCMNCHRKVSNPADNSKAPTDPPILETIGHYLLGLIDILLLILERLTEFGGQLIEAANQCQRPWGWEPCTVEGTGGN